MTHETIDTAAKLTADMALQHQNSGQLAADIKAQEKALRKLQKATATEAKVKKPNTQPEAVRDKCEEAPKDGKVNTKASGRPRDRH